MENRLNRLLFLVLGAAQFTSSASACCVPGLLQGLNGYLPADNACSDLRLLEVLKHRKQHAIARTYIVFLPNLSV